MSMTTRDEIKGACACGWFPPRVDPVRRTQEHAELTGHTVTFQILRTITVKRDER